MGKDIKQEILTCLSLHPERTIDQICVYLDCQTGDDKKTVARSIKELAWDDKVTSQYGGLFVLVRRPSAKAPKSIAAKGRMNNEKQEVEDE